VVGVVAALRPEKNHELFLHAAALVHKQLPAARFLGVGDGPRGEALRSLAKELAIDEAVYFLDFLTGDLRGLVVSKMSGAFRAVYTYNVLADLGIDAGKNPRFMMVTGMANLRTRGGTNVLPSKSIIYVAEVTSGKVAAYAVPWSASQHAAGQTFQGSFLRLDVTRFRAPVMTGGAGTQ